MKKEIRIFELPTVGIVMLILACAAIGANAATIVQSQEFSFLPYAIRTLAFDRFDNNGGSATLTGVHITPSHTYEYTGAHQPVPESEPPAILCMSVVWALFIRRRSH